VKRSSTPSFRDGEVAETLEMAEPGFSAYLDIDHAGNVLGVEFLSFEEFKELLARSGGRLEIPDTVEEPDAPIRARRQDREYSSEALREAISSLTSRQQELLRLRFMEGYTASEIGERLGISVAAAYRGIRAALGKLNKVLEADTIIGETVPMTEAERSLVDALSALDQRSEHLQSLLRLIRKQVVSSVRYEGTGLPCNPHTLRYTCSCCTGARGPADPLLF